MYLETMERLFGGTDKIIMDSGAGVVPYLPLDQLSRRPQPPAPRRREPPMRLNLVGGIVAAVIIVALISLMGRCSRSTRPARRWSYAWDQPCAWLTQPGLHSKIPLIDSLISIDKRILDLENPAQECHRLDQKRLVVDAFARYSIKNR